MSLELAGQCNLMTADQIAGSVGIDKRRVFTKKGIDNYFAGIFPNPSGTGRPVKMYRPEALSLWGKSENQIVEANKKVERKGRDDKGGVRWTTPEKLKEAIELTKQLYINNAQANLVLACEKAANKMHMVEGYEAITGERLHRRLQRKDKYFRSEFFQENWEMIRQKGFKVKDFALNAGGSIRYDNWRIMETAGVANRGNGACQVIVIDDFKRDVWVKKQGLLEMPGGIAYLDGISGYPLLILPAPSITTEAVAAGMVMVCYAYDLPENAIWVMENSKSMKNVNIEMLARSMYTKEELYDFENGKVEWVKQVFYGQTGPVVRSLPHIPKHPFKAKIERFFKIIKDEFDATRSPMNYQGGSRQESTQLTLAATPLAVGQETPNLPAGFYTYEYEDYWQELYKWLYSDCIQRQRPVMLQEWSREKSKFHGERIQPTINECFNYYRNTEFKREPDEERVAYLLYWAKPERHHPKNLWTVRQLLYVNPTIDGKHLNLFSEEIDESVIGRKIATIPIPWQPDKFLLFIADDVERPKFLCAALEFTANDSKKIPIMRAKTQQARETINNKLDEQRKVLAAWDNTEAQGTLPEPPPKWSEKLMPNYNKPISPDGENGQELPNSLQPKQLNTCDEVEIADDLSELLSDIDNLLID